MATHNDAKESRWSPEALPAESREETRPIEFQPAPYRGLPVLTGGSTTRVETADWKFALKIGPPGSSHARACICPRIKPFRDVASNGELMERVGAAVIKTERFG